MSGASPKKAFLYFELTRILRSPFACVACLVFVLFTVTRYLLTSLFLTEHGSTDLHMFFSAMPYVSVIVIPTLGSLLSVRERDFFLPFQSLLIVSVRFAVLLSSYILLCLIPTVTVPVLAAFLGDVEVITVLLSYAGMILYAAAAAALCTLANVLIRHAGISFAVSALILAVADSAHLVPSAGPVLRFLSFAWHFDSFSKGIIDSRDVAFYVCAVCLLILSALSCMERERGGLPPDLRRIVALSFVAASLACADLTRLYIRLDLTSAGQFSVSEYSRKLLHEVSEPLFITYYRSRILRGSYPQIKDVEEFLYAYSSQNDLVSLSVVDPAGRRFRGTGIEARLSACGVQTMQIQGKSVCSAVVIQYLGNTEVIPLVTDCSALEYDLDSRVQHLVRSRVRMVQVAVGNGMSLDADYPHIRPWLESQGFAVQETFIPSESSGTERPSFMLLPDIPLVILGSKNFRYPDGAALVQFMQNGGKTFIATTPYTVDLHDGWSIIPGGTDYVQWALGHFGIYMQDTPVSDSSNFRIAMHEDSVLPGAGAVEYIDYPLWPSLPPQRNARAGLISFWPCEIYIDEDDASSEGFFAEPYLVTSPLSWLSGNTGGDFITNPFLVPRAADEMTGLAQRNVSAALYRNGELSGIVLADQYALCGALIQFVSGKNLDARSLEFLTDGILKLSGEEELVRLREKNIVDKSLHKISAGRLMAERGRLIVLTSLASVMIAAVIEAAFLISDTRRKKSHEKNLR